jgi:hypothetical protein
MSKQVWDEERQRIRIEKILSKIESERKNGIVRYTPAGEVFAEIDRIIDEADAIS